MGKLTITVHSCSLHRPALASGCTVNPRVAVVVDKTYKFQTHARLNTFNPEFNETFTVGNTHRYAMIQVVVYHSTDASFLPSFTGIDYIKNALANATSATTGGNGGGDDEGRAKDPIIGTCYISIRRLVQGRAKRRTFLLGTPTPRDEDTVICVLPQGVSGTITITLESDSLGESPGSLTMDEEVEAQSIRRIERLLLQYDKPKIQVIDLLIAHVREYKNTNTSGGAGGITSSSTVSAADSPPSSGQGEKSRTTIVAVGGPELTFAQPTTPETFDELIRRLCRYYGGLESIAFRVMVHIDGLSNLNKSALNTSLVGSDDVYVVLRTEREDHVSGSMGLQNTVVWSDNNETGLDVVNPSSFVIQVIVMGKNGSKHYEIGRSSVSVAPLARGHASARHLFLCTYSNIAQVNITGVVHLTLQPTNFGLVPIEQVAHVDEFYNRLSKFFNRYDSMRIPLVDIYIRSRLWELEEFMQDLVVEHGREPGSVRLLVTIDSVYSLMDIDGPKDLHEQEVIAIITMGTSAVRTKARVVRQNVACVFDESYLFDVVRETDMIRVDIVKANDETVIYGRVDFTCLNTQRGVRNNRKFHLVGNAGTTEAYFSGVVRVGLYSDQIGHAYEVDTVEDCMYSGRMRRYAYRRLPESLHRINLAVATVFDMETFMAQMAAEYGEEDPTHALYFTVLGCRQLKSRFGGINPYVVVRVGIDFFQTKCVKLSTEPDFFECCEFYFDRAEDSDITLLVMDQSDMGADREIGRAVISLADVVLGRQYYDFVPIYPYADKNQPRETGTVGFKYTAMDLNLVDRTRTLIASRQRRNSAEGRRGHQRREMRRQSSGGEDGYNSGGDEGGGSVSNTGGSRWSLKWSAFKKQIRSQQHLLGIQGGAGTGRGSLHSRSNSSIDANSDEEAFTRTNSILPAPVPTFNLMDEGIEGIDEFCDSQLLSAVPSAYNSEDDVHGMVQNEGEELSSAVSSFTSFPGNNNNNSTSLSKTALVAPTYVPPQARKLHVRLLYCKNLLSSAKAPPNPYVLLSTVKATHRSRLEFGTSNPQYNEEFSFDVEDPGIDELRITVLTDTPYGAKKLGHCVLSMRNVQRGQPRTRWAALVQHPYQEKATEYGSVCITTRGENFGLDYMPSVDAENRFRERLREFLMQAVPQRLHALEWYVGTYSHRESIIMRKLFGETATLAAPGITDRSMSSFLTLGKKVDPCEIEVVIESVNKLHNANMLVEGNCVVKVKVGTKTKSKTRSVHGSGGQFAFAERCMVLITDPAEANLCFSVILNGSQKAGECYVSLADLHKGVAQKRTHVLVIGARSATPQACGFITVSLRSFSFGSSAAPPTAAEQSRYVRLSRYYLYYLPSELAHADVKYATTLNMDAYLKKLVEKYGPEPGNYVLKLSINRCCNVNVTRAEKANPFCILRCGLDEYRTSIVQGKTEFVFFESFDLIVGLPEREKVELILMNYFPSKSVELGRTQIPLDRIERSVSNAMRLPIVMNAGTKSAEINGVVELELFTEDFGIEPDLHARSHSTAYYAPAIANDSNANADHRHEGTPSLAPTGDAAGHRDGSIGLPTFHMLNSTQGAIPSHMLPLTAGGKSVETDEELSTSLSRTLDGTSLAMLKGVKIALTSIVFAADAVPEKDVIVRVSNKDDVLYKTKTTPITDLAKMTDAVFMLEDTTTAPSQILTLKLSVDRFIGADALCYADFSIAHCAPKRTTERTLRLYRTDNKFLGLCRLSISVPPIEYAHSSDWTPLPTSEVEPIMDDLASLVHKYNAKDLRKLSLAFFRAADIRRLHRSLRLQVAPNAVGTVYVAVHSIATRKPGMHSRTTGAPFVENSSQGLVVSAAVGKDTVEASRLKPGSKILECGMTKHGVDALTFPLLRVDITRTGADAVMTLQVTDTEANDGGNSHHSSKQQREIGCATVSLRALLTPKVYAMSEKVTVPLVSLRHATNRSHATLMGTITFSLLPPAFESYPVSVRFSSTAISKFDRDYVRYYADRICSHLKHYDANTLESFHAFIYEMYVATGTWRKGLPDYLSELVLRWGPELEEAGPVPRPNNTEDADKEGRRKNDEDEYDDSLVSPELEPPRVFGRSL